MKRLWTLVLALLLSCSTSFSLFALGKADDESVPPWIMQSHTMQDSYYIFDRQKQNTLFEKDSARVRPEPLSRNLLLLLVVTDRLDSNIQLTVSQDSADLSLQENIMGIRLKAGQRYPLEYLLYGLGFYNSEAVFDVLADAVAEDPAGLVKLLNEKARSLGLGNTEVKLSADQRPEAWTNLPDLGQLLLQALASNRLSTVFQEKSKIFFLEKEEAGSYMENRLSSAWTWSSNRIKGAFNATGNETSTSAYLSDVPNQNFDILILQSSHVPSDVRTQDIISQGVKEAYSLVEQISTFYELVPLVRRGEHCRTIVQQDGVEIQLVYLDDVYYIRPVSLRDFRPETRLSVPTLINLPINRGDRLGQMSFTMPDGTRYTVAVGASEDILSDNSILGRFMEQVKSYPQLAKLVILLAFLLLLVFIIRLIVVTVRRILISRSRQGGRWNEGF